MSCKKCDSPRTVTLRKKDFYCKNCFMINTNHKFRACLGKKKVLSPNEHVMVCLSGGAGSTVLLDLIYNCITLDNTKKLRIVPFFLHIIDDDQKDIAQYIVCQCKKYNFNVYLVHLSNYLNTSLQLPEPNSVPPVDQDVAIQFKNMLNSMPNTAVNDFLMKVKRNLFIKCAKFLHCNIIFTAETTNTLAINLLSNLAVGRGSQVQNDVGFSDDRHELLKIVRPIRDITKEELDYYIAIKQLQPISKSKNRNNSLQSVISSFIDDLQENFQSTISTVCKTADKIGQYNGDRTVEKCSICESELKAKDLKMSALEAITVSRTFSLSNTQVNNRYVSNDYETNTDTVFPFVHTYLCYGCSRNHSEMRQPTLLHLKVNNLNVNK